jgi:uncharacterized protein (TIGR01777 family)
MRVTILGASGFIGRHLTAALRARGDDVLAGSIRDLSKAVRLCEGADVVVNLAGEPVSQKWTPEAKEAIRKTRIDAPHALIDAIVASEHKPGAYVSASAIGYYGTSEDATFTEASPPGEDFLADVCVGWEHEAKAAGEHGIRVAIVRTGIVLGKDGGALAKLLPLYKLTVPRSCPCRNSR